MWKRSWRVLCNLEKENSQELLRIWKIIFWTNYHSFQNHHRRDQWRTFTFSSTKTSVHSGLCTSLLACSWSVAVLCLYASNTICQIIYFEDAYLQCSFIASLNTVAEQNTWRRKVPPSMTTWISKEITLFKN